MGTNRSRCNHAVERLENIPDEGQTKPDAPDVTFPEDARWNADRQAVEFGSRSANTVGWSGTRGAYSNAYCPKGPPPERCVEAYYLQRTRFESIAERKLRRRLD